VDGFAAELLVGGVVPDRLADHVAIPLLAWEAGDDRVAEQLAVVAVLDAQRVAGLLVPREDGDAEVGRRGLDAAGLHGAGIPALRSCYAREARVGRPALLS
jgi:hypothetical protein